MAFDTTTATLCIAAIATIYAVLSMLANKKFGNPKRVKEIQENFNTIKKDLDAAMKKKDNSAIDACIKRQEEAMPTMYEMMLHMYKPFIAIIPLLIIFANPQLNFNESYIFAWPASQSEIMQMNSQYVMSSMGLPQGTSMIYVNESQLHFVQNGEVVASLDRMPNSSRAVFHHDGKNQVLVQLRSEQGKDAVYFPLTRIENPFSVVNIFRGFVIVLPVHLPVFIQHLFDIGMMFNDFNKWLNWRDTFGPNGWFWICVVLAGIGISIINSQVDKKKAKDSQSDAKGNAAAQNNAAANNAQ